jgi:hypothetical protein
MTMPSAARYGGRPPGCSPCNRCGRPILFVRNLVTGKSIPVEPVPDIDGTISAGRHPSLGLIGWPISADRPHQHPNKRYMVHQAICPVRPGPAQKTKQRRRAQPPLPYC